MTDRIARATRAQAAWDEFIAPMLGEMDAAYTARIVEVANTELLFWRRTGKLTALSNGLRIVEQLRNGMLAIIKDGELARNEKARAEKIRQMTAPQRRLLNIVGN